MTALLYEIIYVCVAATGLLSYFLPMAGVEKVTLPALFVTLILACIVPVLRKSGWTVRLTVVGILIAIGVAAAFLVRNDAIREFLLGYSKYMYLPLIALGALIIGEALVYIKPLKLIVSALLIAFMIWAGITSYAIDKYMLFCVAAMLIITIIEVMQGGWKKSGDTDAGKHLVYVFIFVLVTLNLILICPAPDDAYDWKFVKNIAHAAYELFLDVQRKLTPDGIYDPTNASIGFSGRGEILGNLAHQQDEVLELNELSTGIKVLRLTGKTFDTFDGRRWYSNDPSEGDDGLTDTLAFLAAVSEYTDNPDDFARRSSFRIECLTLQSGYVFAPLKSPMDPNAIAQYPVDFAGGDMTWAGNKPDKYSITFYRLNNGNPVFYDFLKNAHVPSESSFNEQLEKEDTAFNYTSYADYLAYIDHVKEYYLQPVVLSDELRAYMDEVYEGCEDDIDKAVKLCELLKGFEYNNSPGDFPEYVTDSSSMLDYFVLESRRGYCAHFATAFVLLARAEGIPARFVQGYYVPTGGSLSVTVYTSMAHAWPEIYVDGAGWIAFEPTPGYTYGSYWYTSEQAADAYGNIGTGYEGYHGHEEAEVPEEPEPAEEEEVPETVIPWYVIVIPAVSGAVFVILFIIAGNLIVSFSFGRKAADARYKVFCRQIFGLLALLGMETGQGETLSEFGERISGDAGDEISDFIGNLTLFLYADGEAEMYEKQAYSYRNSLLKRLRKERPIKYLTYYLGFQKVKYGKSVDNA